MSSFLPPEIVSNILSRLPVKPLLRFRCVSKPWCCLIDSPDFVKLQFHQSIRSKSNRHLTLLFKNFSLHSIELRDLESRDFNPFYSNTTQCLEPPVLDTFLMISCNGLCHISTRTPTIIIKGKITPESDTTHNYIWNPFTRMYRKLPAIPFDYQGLPSSVTRTEQHGFAYVSETDEYKVLQVTEIFGSNYEYIGNQAHIFSTCSNEWETLEPFPYRMLPLNTIDAHLNGVLHTPAETDGGQWELMAFDSRTKKHSKLPKPGFDIEIFDLKVHVFEGNLGLLHIRLTDTDTDVDDRVDIWVMKDYGVKASWFKLLSVGFEPGSDLCKHPLIMTHSENGDEVLMSDHTKKIIWYNLSGERVKEVMVTILPFTFLAEVWTERLVSFPGFISVDDGKHWQGEKKDGVNKRSQPKRRMDKGNTSSAKGFLSKGFKLKL